MHTKRGRDQGAQTGEQAEEGDDDQGRTDPPRHAEALQPIHAGRHRDPEQHTQEEGEEERIGEPDEAQAQVHRQHERGGSHDVAASPTDGSAVLDAAPSDPTRWHAAAPSGLGGIRVGVAGRSAVQVARGVASRIGHAVVARDA